MFSREFWEISKNTLFAEQLRTTASKTHHNQIRSTSLRSVLIFVFWNIFFSSLTLLWKKFGLIKENSYQRPGGFWSLSKWFRKFLKSFHCRKHWTKNKVSFEDFFGKCEQVRRKTVNLFTFTKKSLMENFIFCAVKNCWSDNSIYSLFEIKCKTELITELIKYECKVFFISPFSFRKQGTTERRTSNRNYFIHWRTIAMHK